VSYGTASCLSDPHDVRAPHLPGFHRPSLIAKEVNSMLKHFELPSVADDLRTSEEGQTMAEYGVVLAVITAAIFVALGFLSGAIAGALDKVTAML
jgi:Flp pilus assembly pilin Flp